MSEHLLKAMLGDESLLVGQVAQFSTSVPVDFYRNNMRFLRSGYVETDTAKFDSDFWAQIRIQPEKVSLPFAPVAVTDNGAGVIIAVKAGRLDGSNVIAKSVDNGKTWTTYSNINTGGGTTQHIVHGSFSGSNHPSCLVYIDGFFYLGTQVGAGGRAGLLRSVDGITWVTLQAGNLANNGNAAACTIQLIKVGDDLYSLDTTGAIHRSANSIGTWLNSRLGHSYRCIAGTSDGRLFAYGNGLLHHTSTDRSIWFTRVISASGHIANDMAITILPNGEYDMVLVGSVTAGLYYTTWRITSGLSLDNTANNIPAPTTSVNLGSNIPNLAITSIAFEDNLTIIGIPAATVKLFETSTSTRSAFGQRKGLVDGSFFPMIRQHSGWIYVAPNNNNVNDLYFYRFKNLVAAAGIPFENTENTENTENGVTDYVRIS